MGQCTSDTSKDEDLGNLESSFANYLMTIKTESKIISQETIHSVESQMKKGNLQRAHSIIGDALKDIDNATINIAVTGEAGAGKSSFINALRGVGPKDEDAAEVGVTETTIKRAPYKHPKIRTLTLWDLPGIGTMNFPPEEYLEKVKFQEYDFFIIVSASRFTKHELDLAKAIIFMKRNYYIVRTKVDTDLQNEEKNEPSTFDREKTLQKIRSSYVNTFSQYEMDVPQIFLISNRDVSDYDFPVLMDTLIKNLPNEKRHNFMLSLPNITEAAIDRKRESMRQFIWLEACKAGAVATMPLVGLFRDEKERLKVKLNRYRDLFGVDDTSLEAIAKNSQVPVEQLKKILKSPYLLETEKEKTLEKLASETLDLFASATGGPLGAGVFFRKTIYFQHLFLDTVTEDAKVLLTKTYSKI
ncbi:hypothetical protein ACRRTK_020808 [Alexandromys fortis]